MTYNKETVNRMNTKVEEMLDENSSFNCKDIMQKTFTPEDSFAGGSEYGFNTKATMLGADGEVKDEGAESYVI